MSFLQPQYLAVCGLLIITGCEHREEAPVAVSYLAESPAGTFQAIERFPQLQPFAELFVDLSVENLRRNIDTVYAEKLYFNDTFHTFYQRSELEHYLVGLADSAKTSVTILDVSAQGGDLLVRWVMQIETSVGWKTLELESVGITHLRFDQEGKIILHKDYWDAAGGFYEHLPVLGTLLRQVRYGLED